MSAEQKGIEGRSSPAPPSISNRQILGLVGMIMGLSAAGIASWSGLAMAVFTLLSAAEVGIGAGLQQAMGIAALGIGLGLIMAVVGWRVWKELPSTLFRPPRTRTLWLALGIILAVGTVVSFIESIQPYLLPFINTLAMFLLPLLILTIVGKNMGEYAAGSWRDVAAGLLGGAGIGTFLAMLIEIGVAVTVVALVLVIVPGAMDWTEAAWERVQDPQILSDPQFITDLISPGIVLMALFFVAVVTPLVEEAAKTVAVGLLGLWLRPHPARAFMLGVASGAGFALAENVLNGNLIGTIWGAGVVARLAATVMHCAASGLVGWGWGELWKGRRPLRLLLAFSLSVLVHGVWNSLSVNAAVSGLYTTSLLDDPAHLSVLAILVTLIVLLMIAMSGVILTGLIWAARKLGQGDSVRQAQG